VAEAGIFDTSLIFHHVICSTPIIDKQAQVQKFSLVQFCRPGV